MKCGSEARLGLKRFGTMSRSQAVSGEGNLCAVIIIAALNSCDKIRLGVTLFKDSLHDPWLSLLLFCRVLNQPCFIKYSTKIYCEPQFHRLANKGCKRVSSTLLMEAH